MRKYLIPLTLILVVGGSLVLAFDKRPRKRRPAAAVASLPDEKSVRLLLVPGDRPGTLKTIPAPPEPVFNPFEVSVAADKLLDDRDGLAGAVAAKLSEVKPLNNGRKTTFRRLDEDDSLTWVGWALQVRKVEKVGSGWRATVRAYARVRTGEGQGRFVSIRNHHTEIWTWDGGALRLVDEKHGAPRNGEWFGMSIP